MTDETSSSPAVDSGIVQLGDLRMYYEVHGDAVDSTPLVLLHGGLFDIDQQFGALIPDLASGRRVIAVDFQGHGRTNDIDRPFSAAAFAADVLGVLDHLGVARADIFGFSVGGAVALELAIDHPERVRKVVVSSTSFAASGMRGSENADAVGAMTVDMIAGTPMEAAYLAKSPHPDLEHLQGLLDKLGATYAGGFPDRTDAEIRAIEAPTLITVGDADMVSLEHAVQFLRLRGGDVNGDFDGVPGIPARRLSRYVALLRAGADGPGPRCGHRLPLRRTRGSRSRGALDGSRTRLVPFLQEAHHLRDPDGPLIRPPLRRVDPPQPGSAIELRERVEEGAGVRMSIERSGDVRCEIRSLRSFRFEHDLDVTAVRQRHTAPGRAEHDDHLCVLRLDDAPHRTVSDRASHVMTGLGAPLGVRVERNRDTRTPLPIHGDRGAKPSLLTHAHQPATSQTATKLWSGLGLRSENLFDGCRRLPGRARRRSRRRPLGKSSPRASDARHHESGQG